MKCHDNLSGESFEIPGVDVVAEIEQWVADGVDIDSGIVGYDVETEDGSNYMGEVDPAGYQD